MKPKAVRVIYLVPQGGIPWPEARIRATEILKEIQRFFKDEMKRLGYGPKTFEIAIEHDGLVNFREFETTYPKTQFEAGSAKALHLVGKVVGPPDQNYAEVCFVEAYSVKNGEVIGATAGYSKRRACLSSVHLKAALPEWLSRNDHWAGQVFPWISLEPLSRWDGRGPQLGDLAGASFGAITHELAHCFGPQNHNRELDGGPSNEHIMGRGSRKMRSYFQGNTLGNCAFSSRAAEMISQNLPDPTDAK